MDHIPTLSIDKDGYFVLGETVLKCVENCQLTFDAGKGTGIATLDITLPVKTAIKGQDTDGSE